RLSLRTGHAAGGAGDAAPPGRPRRGGAALGPWAAGRVPRGAAQRRPGPARTALPGGRWAGAGGAELHRRAAAASRAGAGRPAREGAAGRRRGQRREVLPRGGPPPPARRRAGAAGPVRLAAGGAPVERAGAGRVRAAGDGGMAAAEILEPELSNMLPP